MIAFDPARVGLVDKVGESLLVRGPEPLKDGKFTYEEICSAVGVTPGSFKLIDVSLIDNTGERAWWSTEMMAFSLNPDTFPTTYWPPYLHGHDPRKQYGDQVIYNGGKASASWVWWPIEGLSASEPSPQTFLKAPGWDLDGLVKHAASLLGGKNLVYVHCTLGADRTGAFVGGYYMRIKGLSLDQAMIKVTDGTQAKVIPNADYKRLLEAYSKFIK